MNSFSPRSGSGQHDIFNATYYNWKFKFGGMQASDFKRMKKKKRELNQLKGKEINHVVIIT